MTNKLLAGALACTCLVGTLSMAQNGGTEERQTQATMNTAKLEALREKRLQICQSYKEAVDALFSVGDITFEQREDAAQELFEAEVDMASGARVADVYNSEIERLSEVEKSMQARFQSGHVGPRELMIAKLRRVKLEIKLAKLQVLLSAPLNPADLR